LVSVVFPIEGPAGDKDVAAIYDGCAQRLGLTRIHDAGDDVVIEGEDGNGGLADRESSRRLCSRS
jgi:hypothetical protein